MKLSTLEKPIQIELFDAHGLGAGGSGAAAGLLHPYTPRGKLLWQGLPAFQASLDLVNAAEEARTAVVDTKGLENSKKRRQFVWRHGLLRPARTAKQAKDFSKAPSSTSGSSSSLVCAAQSIETYEELLQLVPGLDPKILFPAKENDRASPVGFYVEQAVVINPRDYLLALWESCLLHARASSPLASAQLCQNRSILSLTELESQDGPFDGIVVAAGAAVNSIIETAGVLELDLCQGYTLDIELPLPLAEQQQEEKKEGKTNSSLAYPAGAPGLLGSPYISPQGTHKLVVGATQQHECALEDAVAALGPASLQKKDSKEWKIAVDALVPNAAQLWPPVGDTSWQVATVRSGYRALPQRTAEGSIPYAGKLKLKNNTTISRSTAIAADDSSSSSNQNWWVVGGLGARGLVYHGWLGKLVAEGMVEKSDEQVPKELKRWGKKFEGD
jgi:glycine/D-amino acid oxidase-like deaminating enzyme